jgi:sodium/potassium-transporting ATPase subunit alpha
MITGNTVEAATANARSLHLITGQTANEIAEEKDMAMGDAINESNAIVVDGDDLRRFEEEDQNLPIQERGRRLEEILSKDQIVFARTGPAEKLKILKACKNAGEIVAVVVNDSNSKSLREADVGVVLESSSNDNSKEAADLLLLNDDFSTLAAAIAESRCNFDNIKKSIAFVLTSQWARMLPYIGLIAFQFPLPLSAATLLYISLVTDLIPAIAFAFEEP